jgi:pyridoxine 4-dehydrogenase
VMLPIPGTSSLAHLEDNMAAAKVKLTPEEWKAIDALAGWSLFRALAKPLQSA